MSSNARVRLPNGQVQTARVEGLAETGYRRAYVRVTNEYGQRVSIAGRVPTRHGLRDRVLPFEVNMDGVNAVDAFRGGNKVFAG